MACQRWSARWCRPASQAAPPEARPRMVSANAARAKRLDDHQGSEGWVDDRGAYSFRRAASTAWIRSSGSSSVSGSQLAVWKLSRLSSTVFL